jgi:hypothetical protein
MLDHGFGEDACAPHLLLALLIMGAVLAVWR